MDAIRQASVRFVRKNTNAHNAGVSEVSKIHLSIYNNAFIIHNTHHNSWFLKSIKIEKAKSRKFGLQFFQQCVKKNKKIKKKN